MWITNGGFADFYLVFATTDRSKKHRGIVSLIVPADLPGIRHGEPIDKMGQRASNTTAVTFKDVLVPKENLLAGEGEGFRKAMAALDITRPMIAAGAVGLARSAMELAARYARQRVQFEVPIADHQAVQFLLADMAIGIEGARLLVWRAAAMADQGLTQHPGGGDCQSLRRRRGHESDHGRGSDLRGNGVYEVASGGEAHAGRQGHSDL